MVPVRRLAQAALLTVGLMTAFIWIMSCQLYQLPDAFSCSTLPGVDGIVAHLWLPRGSLGSTGLIAVFSEFACGVLVGIF